MYTDMESGLLSFGGKRPFPIGQGAALEVPIPRLTRVAPNSLSTLICGYAINYCFFLSTCETSVEISKTRKQCICFPKSTDNLHLGLIACFVLSKGKAKVCHFPELLPASQLPEGISTGL